MGQGGRRGGSLSAEEGPEGHAEEGIQAGSEEERVGRKGRPLTSSDPTLRMPVGFVGHGNPMSVLDEAKGVLWREWGASLPRPRAILTVSAHWQDSPVTIGRVVRHEALLYDLSRRY